MKFQIKSRYEEDYVIFECELGPEGDGAPRSAQLGEAVKKAPSYGADLRGADLRDADLSYADLRGADLSYADLRDADLSYADLRGVDLDNTDLQGAFSDGFLLQTVPIDISGLKWPVRIGDMHMRIGCQVHKLDDWEKFSDDEISGMADGALDCWRQWKEPLFAIARAKGWTQK